MSPATSANGINLICRPVHRMSADEVLNGLGTDVLSDQFMTRVRNRQSRNLFFMLPSSPARKSPARLR